MAVRERWIYPSDGSPPYRVDTEPTGGDARVARGQTPGIAMNLGLYNRMERQGKVPVSEHHNVTKDAQRQREYRRQDLKRDRLRDVVNVVKGYGI